MREFPIIFREIPPLCIYHGNCYDGFGAACAVRLWHPDTEFCPGVFGEPPPDVTGRDVIIVDFSYPRAIIEDMIEKSASFTLLDHHKTAQADLEGLRLIPKRNPTNIIFDMKKSGAMLAWEFFHPSGKPPQLIEHIQDRDLWRFALKDTREIHAALSSYPMDFDVWDDLIFAEYSIQHLREEGRTLERKQNQDIAMLLPIVQRRMIIGGYNVPVANLPITMVSDAGNAMCRDDEPFAACYFDTPRGRSFSLRSIGEFDVSEVAKKYGGGGHRNAAGFQRSHGWEGDAPSE